MATASSTSARPPLRPWNPAKGPEPTAPKDLTLVEERALRRLIDEEYLLYQNVDRTCPFPKLFNKADKAYERISYYEMRPPKLADMKGEHIPSLVREVESFKKDLILNIGDDVVAGTIFALNISDEKEYFKLNNDEQKNQDDDKINQKISFNIFFALL